MLLNVSRSLGSAFTFFLAMTVLLLGFWQIDSHSQIESDIDSIPDLAGGGGAYAIYENSNYGVKLEYPESWALEEGKSDSDNPMELVYFYNDAEDNSFKGDFAVSIERLDRSRTMQDYVQKTVKQYQKNIDGFKLDSTSWDTLGGFRAYSILYRENYNSTTNLKILEVGAIRDEVVYFIEYFAFDKEFDKNFPIARKMIDSFQFINGRSQT
jgi:hypothetical protein